jgi:hypothetical protein
MDEPEANELSEDQRQELEHEFRVLESNIDDHVLEFANHTLADEEVAKTENIPYEYQQYIGIICKYKQISAYEIVTGDDSDAS